MGSIDVRKISGIPLGRIFIPHTFSQPYEILPLYHPTHIIEAKPYESGIRIYFVAPISKYCSLAHQFPHRKYATNTEYLLTSASNFFRTLNSF